MAELQLTLTAEEHQYLVGVLESVLKKALVEEQRRRFPDIENYPCLLSQKLEKLRDDLTGEMLADNSGWQDVLKMPELVPDDLLVPE